MSTFSNLALTLWHPASFRVFAGFTRVTRVPKVIESCSKAQKTQQVF